MAAFVSTVVFGSVAVHMRRRLQAAEIHELIMVPCAVGGEDTTKAAPLWSWDVQPASRWLVFAQHLAAEQQGACRVWQWWKAGLQQAHARLHRTSPHFACKTQNLVIANIYKTRMKGRRQRRRDTWFSLHRAELHSRHLLDAFVPDIG